MPTIGSSACWSMPRGPSATWTTSPATKLGITRGRAATTLQKRGHGRLLRTVSQATGTAMTTDATVTVTTSARVRSRIMAVRHRSRRAQASSPAPAVRMTR